MAQKMSERRDRYQMEYKNTYLKQYSIDDLVLVFDPKLKNFSMEGRVISYDHPPSDSLGPCAYEVNSRRGGGGRSISNG